ncbi:MAG: potassium channel family protein [Acidimicrobiia bacterium]
MAAYFAVPARDVDAGQLVVRISLALVALVISLVVAIRYVGRTRVSATSGAPGIRYVGRTRYPVLGLVQALAVVIGLAVVSFASTHLLISANDAAAFTEPLDHIGALYFTLTTATTIGYGDIAPRSDLARVVVMLHMVVNVAVVGLGVRALVRATRRRIE